MQIYLLSITFPYTVLAMRVDGDIAWRKSGHNTFAGNQIRKTFDLIKVRKSNYTIWIEPLTS